MEPRTNDSPTRDERLRGALLGVALGDALGARFETTSAEDLRMRYPSAAAFIEHPPGRSLFYTDDTQMAVAVARTIVAVREPEVDDYARAFAEDYDDWRGYGRSGKLFAKLRAGTPLARAQTEINAAEALGNGSAIRALPIGLGFAELPVLREQARRSAIVTHLHPLAIEAAVLVAKAAWLAERSAGAPFFRAAFIAELRVEAESDEIGGALDRIATLDSPDGLLPLVRPFHVVDSVVAGLACFMLFPDALDVAIAEAVRLGGDCDSMAALAGGLAGARLGAAALPGAWLNRLEDGTRGRRWITQVAVDLAAIGDVARTT